MDKTQKLDKAVNIVFNVFIVFAVLMVAGLIGDIAYRIADQMWALGRYISIITLMIGSAGVCVTLLTFIILSRIHDKHFDAKIAEIDARIAEIHAEIDAEIKRMS